MLLRESLIVSPFVFFFFVIFIFVSPSRPRTTSTNTTTTTTIIPASNMVDPRVGVASASATWAATAAVQLPRLSSSFTSAQTGRYRQEVFGFSQICTQCEQ